ncbi:MAG: SagB/ThcOx family dehydrogenase [Chloroflexi bacterium]|nr:SagB/ThcOx family dehydrogenase [Chloroflexota bacterium]
MSESIGREFMRQSQLRNLGPSAQSEGVPQPPLELPFPADANRIGLPAPADLDMPAVDLRTVVEKRRTLRRYLPDPLSLDELAYLLWMTQGVKGLVDRPSTVRTVPSAGARHAFETYLLVNRVEGLEPGLYRYLALEHALLPLDLSAGVTETITAACNGQQHVRQSAVTFIWVAVAPRMIWRYGERGYRYLHLDAGHVCQNLYLAAESLHCGACALAAFLDDELNQALGLDGEEQFAIYVATLGKRPL